MNTKKFKRVSPEDFDVEMLLAAAREGRLYVDDSPKAVSRQEMTDKVRAYVDPIENLFLMGRNGMHKYNNMDHSMLAAMEVAKCIRENSTDKTALWSVNSEEDYHEGKKA